jgi:hypothetical protein
MMRTLHRRERAVAPAPRRKMVNKAYPSKGLRYRKTRQHIEP